MCDRQTDSKVKIDAGREGRKRQGEKEKRDMERGGRKKKTGREGRKREYNDD